MPGHVDPTTCFPSSRGADGERVPRMPWVVEFHRAFEAWAEGLAQSDAEALLAAIWVLRDEGPVLGRPLVDTIASSRHANMKELRPG